MKIKEVAGIYFVSVITTNIMLEIKDQRNGVGENPPSPPLICISSFYRLPSLGPGLEALLNRLLINC